MPPTTPIASSKTAALSRILDVIPRGYVRYTAGTVSAAKTLALAKNVLNNSVSRVLRD